MASRKHRWPGNDHPLTGVHGGTAKAAQRAIKAAREARLYERARKAVDEAHIRAVNARLDADSRSGRKDKVRPRAWKASFTFPTLLERIAFIQGGRCIHCARGLEFGIYEPYEPWRPSFEHVIPRSLGGVNVGNRLAAHRFCNSVKGSAKPIGCELVMLLAVNARLGVEPTRF